MKLKKFTVEGFELLEKKVVHYKGTGSRVIVPVTWNKVVIIRIE